jgi:hypothetical protein
LPARLLGQFATLFGKTLVFVCLLRDFRLADRAGDFHSSGARLSLPASFGEGASGRRACALFLSSSISAASHAADVSGSVLAICPKGRIYCTHSAALPVRSFDLATTISVIDLKLR